MARWEQVLASLERDPTELVGQVDWIAKRHLVEGFRDRHDLAADDLRLAALDLQYHDLRPERSLFARMGAEVLADPARATGYPPTDTRAFFRGRCLALWPDRVVA